VSSLRWIPPASQPSALRESVAASSPAAVKSVSARDSLPVPMRVVVSIPPGASARAKR
jgi:hypothetical protein